VLCGALWIFISVFYAIARLDNSGSPKFDQLSDNGTYYTFEVIMAVFSGIWAAWFLVHMIKSLGKICAGERAAKLLIHTFLHPLLNLTHSILLTRLASLGTASAPYAFLFLLTAVSALMAVIGVMVGALYPLPDSSFKFLFFYANFNVYVWTLAFAYAPEKDDGGDGHHEEMQNGDFYETLNPSGEGGI
tara:strand:+ start:1018 stop:1584 length:567 start_codon:yes stop_codon:yes gene_type:complete